MGLPIIGSLAYVRQYLGTVPVTYMKYIRIYSKVDAKIHVAVWISWYR